jgi:phage-related protein
MSSIGFLDIGDLTLSFDATVKRSTRSQRIQFGDGYTQVLTDGLNAEKEIWICKTPPIDGLSTWGLEAYFLRKRGMSFEWTDPDASKVFYAQFSAGSLTLGYTNLSSLVLDGYTRPTNYTANLVSGVLTSVNIPNSVPVQVTATLSPKLYVVNSGWEISHIAPDIYQVSFELARVYT